MRSSCEAAELEAGIARFQQRLQARSTVQRAAGAKAYLKSPLEFLGVDTPTLRRELGRWRREMPEIDRRGLTALVEGLWRRGIFELRAAACELLVERVDLLGPRDLLWIERLLREARTWALVDILAPRVAGPIFVRGADDPRVAETRERWAHSDDFWLRRAVLLAFLLPLRQGTGDFDAFARCAEPMLGDREFFVRKAIGWVLREVGKKRSRLVACWLLPRAHLAAGLTVREAVKYLPEAERRAILVAHRARNRS